MHPDRSALVDLRLVTWPLGFAALAEGAAWVLLARADGLLSGAWFGHLDLLMATHLITLGVLGAAIQAAGWQLVPVVTARPPSSAWSRVAWVCNALLLLGLLALLPGLRRGGALLFIGAAAAIGGLSLRMVVVVMALLRAQGRGLTRAWLLAAEGALASGLGFAGALVAARAGHGVLSDHLLGVGRHASLLLGGWVGGWIVGLGGVLLPMFAVAPEPRRALHGLAWLLWFSGLALGRPTLWALGAAVAAAGLLDSLRRRVRRGPEVGVVGAAMGLVGLLAVAVLVGARGMGPAAVALGLTGWALPFLRGVALRVVPFLSWVHRFGEHPRRAPPVASLLSPALPGLAVLGSAGAGVGVAAALGSGDPVLLRAAGALGVLGALCFAITLLIVRLRCRLAALREGGVAGMEAS
ncbi:MAG: hypothetical protein H6739_27390 [Alphaproteobacteria bacterium]|nr:hypothetical protein [Alphaproteobacteria bacterium]